MSVVHPVFILPAFILSLSFFILLYPTLILPLSYLYPAFKEVGSTAVCGANIEPIRRRNPV